MLPSIKYRFLVATSLILVVFGLPRTSSHFLIEHNDTHLQVSVSDIVLIAHSASSPFLFVGTGSSVITSQFGNYKISDNVDKRVPLTIFNVDGDAGSGTSDSEARQRVTFTDNCLNTVSIFGGEENFR